MYARQGSCARFFLEYGANLMRDRYRGNVENGLFQITRKPTGTNFQNLSVQTCVGTEQTPQEIHRRVIQEKEMLLTGILFAEVRG
jgi:hypothetical protein